MSSRAVTRSRLLLSAAVGLVFCVIYAISAPTGLVGADQGEFATLAGSVGAAHPPGYPLYTAYLRLLSPLPGLSVVHSTAIATAALGALAMATWCLALLQWGAGRRAAIIAVALMGLDYTIWSAHTHAEALTLAHLITAAIVLACAPHGPRGVWRCALLGLLAGLGLASHHTMVLLAPIGIYGMLIGLREAERTAAALAAAIGAGLLGLTPYGLLFLEPESCVECLHWGRFESFGDLFHHVSRRDYGVTQLRIRSEREPLVHLWSFARRAVAGTFGLSLFLCARAAWMSRGQLTRGPWLALIGALLASGVVFIAMLSGGTEGAAGYTTARFYFPAITLLTPVVAFAVHTLDERRAWGALSLAIIAVLVLNFIQVRADYSGVLDRWVEDTLESVPRDAVIFGDGDHRTFTIAYKQFVERVRPDVVWIDVHLARGDWYIARAEQRLGVDMPRSDERGTVLDELVARAIETGRPVFLAEVYTPTLQNSPTFPYGTLIRIQLEPPPPPREIARLNAELFDAFAQQPAATPANPWEADALRTYRRPWESLADVFAASGDLEAADRARGMAAAYGGESPTTSRQIVDSQP